MLNNTDNLYSKSKTVSKYFLEREKNDNEVAKEKELMIKVLEFYQKVYDDKAMSLSIGMFDFNLFNFGYIDDYGYYVINYDDWSRYLIHRYGENMDDAFYALVNSVLNRKRAQYEARNKAVIKKDIKNRFGRKIDYDRIFIAEYNLDKWNKFYDGNIPQELIAKYEDFINSDPSIYDAKLRLSYNKNKVTKTLKKVL